MRRLLEYLVLVLVASGVIAGGLLLSEVIRSPRMAHAQSTGDYIPIANGWNISSVASGSAVFTADLKTKNAASVIRIAVVLGSSAPIAIRETDGTHTFTSYLNGSTNLTAGCCYTFVWEMRQSGAIGGSTQSGVGGGTVTTGVSSGVTPVSFNFVVGSPTTVPVIRVTELNTGAD